MKFIKLTLIGGGKIMIAPKHIAHMQSRTSYTDVYILNSHNSLSVKETDEEIMEIINKNI